MATDRNKVLGILDSVSHRHALEVYNGIGSTVEPGCGDEMVFYLKVSPRQVIEKVGFTLPESACMPVVAAAETAARLIEGKPVLAAYALRKEKIAEYLSDDGSMNREHLHCVIMAELTVKKAVVAYTQR